MRDTLALSLALEGASSPSTIEVGRLVGVASLIDTLPDPDIDPRFAALLEARLLAEPIEAPAPGLRLVPQPAAPARESLPTNVIALPRGRFVVRKAIVAAIAAAMLVALPVVAAAQSLPGSPLFGIEQFRQNHAISSAHGTQKAFVLESVARKWFGYTKQETVLGYNAADIHFALGYAAHLQDRAASIVLRSGTPADIAKLRNMFIKDANALREFASATPGGAASSALKDAIANADKQANRLTMALSIPAVPPASNVIKEAATGAASAATATNESAAASSRSTPKSNADAPDVTNGSDPSGNTQKEYQKAYNQTCALMLNNDALGAPSKAICTVQTAGKHAN